MRFAVLAAALVLISAGSGLAVRAAGWTAPAAWLTAGAVLLAGQALYLFRIARIARAEDRRRATGAEPGSRPD
ncbi:MAG: hypothetical protein N2422_01655 [Rhodobacteraceae bacterium]|nr:hypothetical protein [Paracoccaceae bacterium]